MVAAVLVRSPQKVCAPWWASSIRSVISLKVVSIRLRHSAMTFSRLDGSGTSPSSRCPAPSGTAPRFSRAVVTWALEAYRESSTVIRSNSP